MKQRTSLGQRLAAFALALIMVLGMVPVNPIRAIEADSFGIAAGITEGVVVTDGNAANITASFAGTLMQQEENWKIGIQMKAPAGLTDEQLQNATYQAGEDQRNFAQDMVAQDDVRYVQVWGLLTPEALREANLADGKIVYSWSFNWDGQAEAEQTVTLTVNSADVVLLDSESIQVYPGADLGYAAVTELVSPMTITGSETAETLFNLNKRITVEWQTADEAAGRYQDGWWVGVRVTAPAAMTEAQIAAACYKVDGNVALFSDVADGNAFDLWIPLNKLLTDTFVAPVYQFDWNNDGLFEQTLTMDYDNAKLVLMKDGVRVYYLMGQVESLDAGIVTITGSGEQELKVDSNNLVLYYMDAENGRQEGWWSCLRITAPKGISIGQNSDDVKYQYAESVGESITWSYPQSMYANQDSAKDAAVHYMYLWTYVDPIKAENGEQIVSMWRFDWDKNGRYEQTVTHTINTETANLLYVGTDNFYFEDAAEDKKVSLSEGTYQNAVVNKVQASTVKYSLLDDANPGVATIDPETGVVTLLERGTVTVVATLVLNNGYEAMSIGFTFEIVKHVLEGFALTAPAPITYGDNGNIFQNAAIDPTGNGDIRYEIISQESLEGEILDETNPVAVVLDETTGELEIKRSGKITVQATRAEDDTYLTAIATYELIVNRAAQSGKFDEPVVSELTYKPEPYELPAFSGYECGDVITYALETTDGCAELTADNKIQTNYAGSFKLIITISGDERYEEQILALDMTVATSPQDLSNFFQNMGQLKDGQYTIDIMFDPDNTSFTNLVVGGNGTGDVTYEIIDGSNVAQMDPENPGTLLINKSGSVTVQATKAGDEQYAEAKLSYVLNIALSDIPTFSLNPGNMTIYYGVEEITVADIFAQVVAIEDVTSVMENYRLSVAERNPLGAKISENGSLIFDANAEQQTGTITVMVTKAADDRYAMCTQELQLTLVYAQMPEFTVTDADGNSVKPNDAGWYTGDIYIVPAEGWLISAENGRDAVWQDKLLFSQESTGADGIMPVFAFRNTDNQGITELTRIDGYKMDKSAPAVDMVYDGDLTWFEALGDLIGIKRDTVSVTFHAKDYVSGLDYIEYSIDGGKTVAGRIALDGKETANYTIELNAQYRDSVVFWAVDKVGNTAKYEDGKVIVVDAIEPGFVVNYECSVDYYQEGDTLYAQDMKVIFEINADNFDLSEKPVVTVNGTVVAVEWITDGLKNTGVLALATDCDYVVTMSFSDRLGRQVSYEQKINLDNTDPVISVEYNPASNGENGLYYNQNSIQAVITVVEHNFDAAKVAAQIDASDINGNGLTVEEAEKIAAYLLDSANWTNDGDTYTATVTIASDARYALNITCTDKAGNVTSYDAAAFVMDHNAATALEVAYSDSVKFWSDVLNVITFGTYNAEKELIVTVTAKDEISGVNYFEYVFTEQGKEFSDANVSVVYPVELLNEKDASVASASFDIPPEIKGYVSFRVVDMAGNVSQWYHDANAIKIVDITAPETLPIQYSEPVNMWDEILDSITFGFASYNKETKLNVTISATDNLAGVDYFEYVVTTQGEEFNEDSKQIAAAVPSEEDETLASFTFEILPEARGYVSFRAVDKAGNTSEWYHDANAIKIVDTIAPTFDIAYGENYNAVDMDGDEIVDGLYYGGDANLTLKITEANFYGEDVKVFVSKDGAEAEQIAADSIKWNLVEDHYEAVVTLSGEGDYVLTVDYKDRSENAMATFTSERIVIDETAPEVSIAYGLNAENGVTVEDRTYFAAVQTATVTIKEKNFRADEVILTITAVDVQGNPIMVAEQKLSDIISASANIQGNWTEYEANWRRADDTFELQLTFDTEANYTVDVAYTDLAGHASADYTPDLFTVDMTAPQNIKIAYSLEEAPSYQGSVDNVLYYNGDMWVIITATEDISPIDQFVYSYIKAEGVSDVNKELLDGILDNSVITREGNTFTASFYIPKEKIAECGDQFNGTVKFHTIDRAGNSSMENALSDSQIVVVDNIVPKLMNVSFGEPAQTIHGVDYFANAINATIVINEANFFGTDVEVSVSTDGGSFKPVKVRWYNNSADRHTGSFTLDAEGTYVVQIAYKDRSTNEMKSYTSGKMIVDTTAPKIEVSQIAHGTANNADTIGFTLKVTDNNILTENIVPVLKAVVRKGDAFETITIDLAQAEHQGDGVYTVIVENLAEDGFYTFTCTATDNALNASNTIFYGESGEQSVENMNFSVNRNGSTFVVSGSESANGGVISSDLNGQYIKGEVELIIKEINVDKVGEGDKQTVFTLNNGTEAKEIVLTEDNYKMNVQVGEGGWYETTYILDNTYFTEDGVYSINIISYDAANNSNVNTKSPEGTITFTVDRTKPVISANVTDKQIINGAEYKVYFQLTEANLNGETVVAKFNGQEVTLEDLGNNEYSFTVGSGLNHNLEISAKDLAGNEADIYSADPFTVSTNFFVRWYANTFWFWFSIIAVIILAAAIIFFIIFGKRKKDKK